MVRQEGLLHADATELESWSRNGTAVVQVTGQLDIGSAPSLWAAVQDVLTLGECRAMLVDLTWTVFLDSFGIATLLELDKNLRRRGIPLQVVVRADQAARRILRLSGVDRVLVIISSLPEALSGSHSRPNSTA